MMQNEVRIRVTAEDATGPGVESAKRRSEGLGGTIATLRKNWLAVTAATAGATVAFHKTSEIIGGMISAASSLEEAQNKVNVVFGSSSVVVSDFAKTAASAIGQSERQVLAAAGTFGNLFRAMEIGQSEAADMSAGLVKLASDLASFNDIDPTEALDKLRAGLVGEAEPLRTLGVQLSETRVAAKALEMGLAATADELTDQAKVAARYAIIMEDTALAQGDFARTSDGLANSSRILRANMADLQAELGQALLPAAVEVTHVFIDMTRTVSELTDAVGDLGEAFGVSLPAQVKGAEATLFSTFLVFGRLIEGARDLAAHTFGLGRETEAMGRSFGRALAIGDELGITYERVARSVGMLARETAQLTARQLAQNLASQLLAAETGQLGEGVESLSLDFFHQLEALRKMIEHDERLDEITQGLIDTFSRADDVQKSTAGSSRDLAEAHAEQAAASRLAAEAEREQERALAELNRAMDEAQRRSDSLARQFAQLGETLKRQQGEEIVSLLGQGVSFPSAVSTAQQQTAAEITRREEQILAALRQGTIDLAAAQRATFALRQGMPDPILEALGLARPGANPLNINVSIGGKSFEDAVVTAVAGAARAGR